MHLNLGKLWQLTPGVEEKMEAPFNTTQLERLHSFTCQRVSVLAILAILALMRGCKTPIAMVPLIGTVELKWETIEPAGDGSDGGGRGIFSCNCGHSLAVPHTRHGTVMWVV